MPLLCWFSLSPTVWLLTLINDDGVSFVIYVICFYHLHHLKSDISEALKDKKNKNIKKLYF